MNVSTAARDLAPGAHLHPDYDDVDPDEGLHAHSICWGAIFAGAAAAASLSLILLMLGVGLGLSSVSPWSSEGMTATAFGVSTILWLTFTQLAASAMGGYLAGRLRLRWAAVHRDEVYFRDTAHGFLAWSVATVVTAALLSSAAGAIVSGGAKAGAVVAGAATAAAAPAAAAAASAAGPDYFADTLLRKDATLAVAPATATGAAAGTAPAAPTGEVTRILTTSMEAGSLLPDDTRYLGQLVAQRTGLSQQDAEKRVTDTFNRMQSKANAAKEAAKEAADKARKASAVASLWGFISLLIGAFVASLAGTLGGRHRDQF